MVMKKCKDKSVNVIHETKHGVHLITNGKKLAERN